jgi:hypothetical protein
LSAVQNSRIDGLQAAFEGLRNQLGHLVAGMTNRLVQGPRPADRRLIDITPEPPSAE